MFKYKIFEEENIADIKIEVYGKTRKQLLENVVESFSSIVVDYQKLMFKNRVRFYLEGEKFEDLVFKLVEKLIFLKDTKFFVAKKAKFEKITNKFLSGFLIGQKNLSYQFFKIDIKALAHHKFEVKKDKGWRAVMVFDI